MMSLLVLHRLGAFLLCAVFLGPPSAFGQAEKEAESLDIVFVAAPEGSFTMGSPEDAFPSYERPRHSVFVSAFEIGAHEVTNAQYAAFCKDTRRDLPKIPDWYEGEGDYFQEMAGHPVVNVSWHDAVAFCDRYSETHEGVYRLPTEAEWERAARFSASGDTPAFPWGDEFPHHHGEPDPDYGNILGEDRYPYTSPSTGKGVFPEGAARIGGELVFDLIGNVSEWCLDRFSYDYYRHEPEGGWKDPRGPEDGHRRVVKGSSFRADIYLSRPAFRQGLPAADADGTIGFRVVREVSPQS